jgi:hypothetical protein
MVPQEVLAVGILTATVVYFSSVEASESNYVVFFFSFF